MENTTQENGATENIAKPEDLDAEAAGSTICCSDDEDKEDLKSPSTDEAEATPPTMSKRKLKKLAKQEKKKMFMKEKRQKERLRKKQNRREAKAQGIVMGPSRKALKHNTMKNSACKIRAIIDCSFDDLMTEKDIKSLVKQVNFSYSSNRRAADPLQFYVTSFNKRLKASMESIGDYHKWDINTEERSYEEAFGQDQIVYLSSDSKNILQSLEEDKVYVIGGLVDHNHHKGLCLKLAEERGLAHAQLPIADYVKLETCDVLAINHVFDILLRYTESRDWEDAFYKVIPKRKISAAKPCEVDAEDTTVECNVSDTIEQNTVSDGSHDGLQGSADCNQPISGQSDMVKALTEQTAGDVCS